MTTGADHRGIHWFYLAKALADYRGGDFESAVASAQRSRQHAAQVAIYPRATALVVQAMAEHQLGRLAEARQSLRAAHDLMERQMPTPESGTLELHWHDWLRFQILRREAEALIDQKEDGEPEPHVSRDEESSNPGDK